MTNDEKILELKKKIEEEKKSLAALGKFTPKTTCVLDTVWGKVNIRTMNINELQLSLIAVNALIKSAKGLCIESPVMSGFTLEEWYDDISELLTQKKIGERVTTVKRLEAKLQSMLSDEKKTELEIAEIAKLLN